MHRFRAATEEDIPALRLLIAQSVRGLSHGHYSATQIESALEHVFGPDTQLILDGTYYVVEVDDQIAAAGGWSRRLTLFGGDQMKHTSDRLLDPATEPARIRAFFVHPAWARHGLGRLLYKACAAAALAAGFHELELVATLPGEPLYTALGFTVRDRFVVNLPGGVQLPVTRMSRPVESGPASSQPTLLH